MRCATGLGCPVYIYHGRILGIDTISPSLQPYLPCGACLSDAGHLQLPVCPVFGLFFGLFYQGPCALHGMVHSQPPLDWLVTWARRKSGPFFLNVACC